MGIEIFIAGLIAGLYTWLTVYFLKTKFPEKKLGFSLWHGVFGGVITLTAFLVVLLALKNRGAAAAQGGQTAVNIRIYAAVFAGAAAWFFNKGRKNFSGAESARKTVKENAEWAEIVFLSITAAFVITHFIVQMFKVPSGSMNNTLIEGDRLGVNRFIYGLNLPFSEKRRFALKKVKRGDVIVFKFPENYPIDVHCGNQQSWKEFSKRVIGMPGDKIELKDGRVYINGKKAEESSFAVYSDTYRLPAFDSGETPDEYQKIWENRQSWKNYGKYARDNFGPVKVPENSYFVMGDNRDYSCDSRFWGPVPDEMVTGKPWFIYWPLPRIQLVK